MAIVDGDAGNNLLVGGVDPDILNGLAGNDVLDGLAGGDTLNGGEGTEDVASYRDSTAVTVNLALGSGSGGHAQGDVLSGIEAVWGSDGDDVITGDGTANTFLAYAGNDILDGGGDNDALTGGEGADTLIGGAGNDTAVYANAAQAVLVDLRRANLAQLGAGESVGDVLIGIENVYGSTHDDTLIGGAGRDGLGGGAGNDLIDGGGGADQIDGGLGIDTVTYASSARGVTVSLGSAGAEQGGSAAGDILIAVENLIGSSSADVLTGNGNSNNLEGRSGSDTLTGGGGNDILEGGSGADNLIGGLGTDTASYVRSTGAVRVNLGGSPGSGGDGQGDVLTDIENLLGSSFSDFLKGDAGGNRLEGGIGNDSLDGGAGADLLVGGFGNDRYDVDTAGDRIIESPGEGTDTVYASRSYALQAGQEIESLRAVSRSAKTALALSGNEFGNLIAGSEGGNGIRGGGGNDQLYGFGGNDKLTGGAGLDRLYGGSGRDAFVFNTAPDRILNVDRISDFSVRDDTIQLENAVFKALGRKTGTLKASAFHTGGAAHDSNDRVIYNKNSGVLYYDADGTGAAGMVQIATLSKKLKMTFADFFVI